jgi:predicted nucleic acid-binding protein
VGLTVVDAGVVIGYLDAEDPHHAAASRALRAAWSRHDRLVLPASVYAEVLVGPFRKGPKAVAAVHDLVRRLPFEIVPLDVDLAATAAALRARHRSLKLPDALVIATAGQLDADQLLTTDRGWPPRSRLRLAATIIQI